VTAGDIGRELARRQFRVRAGMTPPGPDQRETTLLVTRPGQEGELGKRARAAGFTGTLLFVRAVGPAEAYPRGGPRLRPPVPDAVRRRPGSFRRERL
jgi:hypothetical protein